MQRIKMFPVCDPFPAFTFLKQGTKEFAKIRKKIIEA